MSDGGLVLHLVNTLTFALSGLFTHPASFFCFIFSLLSPPENCPEQQLHLFSPLVLMRNRCPTLRKCSAF